MGLAVGWVIIGLFGLRYLWRVWREAAAERDVVIADGTADEFTQMMSCQRTKELAVVFWTEAAFTAAGAVSLSTLFYGVSLGAEGRRIAIIVFLYAGMILLAGVGWVLDRHRRQQIDAVQEEGS